MTSRLLPTLLFALFVSVSQAQAQDKKDTANQKAAILANLKKADLPTAKIIETDHFFVVSTIPDDKAKLLGTVLEKLVPVARKALQFEGKDEAWKGKLAVYFLPESRDFKSFIRNVVAEKPDSVYFALRLDEPYLVDPVDVAGKPTEADQFANTAAIVAAAYLKGKASSAEVPDWLSEGFGRITAMRAEGLNSKRYTSYKTASKTAAIGPKGGKPAAIAELWAEAKPANADIIASSLMEYIAYGPGKENFVKLVYGFRPAENGTAPTAPQAFEAAGWKDIPVLETAWRKWATTGK